MEHKNSRELTGPEMAMELRGFATERVLVYLLLSSLLFHMTGAYDAAPLQLLPKGIISYNGSSVDMGCPTLMNISSDSDTAKVCGGGCNSSTVSLLVDGESPIINTSDPDWASQLVIVRKNPNDSVFQFFNALLAFRFDVPVLPSAIELDAFQCPSRKIGIADIDVYANDNEDMSITLDRAPRGTVANPNPSCASLVTMTMNITGNKSHYSWYLVVSFDRSELEFEYLGVGEVRFLNVLANSSANGSSAVCSDPLTNPSVADISTTSNIVPDFVTASVPLISEKPQIISFSTSSSMMTFSTSMNISLAPNEPEVDSETLSPPLKFPLVFVFIGAAGGMLLVVFLLGITLCCVIIRRRRKRIVTSRTPFRNNYVTPFQPLPIPLPPTPQQEDSKASNCGVRHSELYEHISEGTNEPLYITLNEIRHSAAFHATNISYSESPAGDDSPLVTFSASTDGDASKTETLDTYITMQPVALVSPDAEQALSRRIIINEGIYSETITPSDFTNSRDADRETFSDSGCEFLAPVYPTLGALPQGFKTVIEISAEKFSEMEELRIGQFGHTVLASTVDLSLKSLGLSKTDNRTINLLVAVKKLLPKPYQVTFQQEDFNRETQFLSQLRHPNVLRYLGVSYSTYFIMMEYMEKGDLNQFLRNYSEIVPFVLPSKNQIATSTLVYIASQIANAMQYLAGLNFIHRDLATRNCYIGANTVVKVGDLGVDMDQYKSSYYPIQGRKQLPIRWMATECFNGKFSEKSDVWAFGVTMWELFTLAKVLPYPDLSDEEVVQIAVGGQSLELPSKPSACTEPMFEIMQQCWVVDMKQRTNFGEIHKLLQKHL